MAQVLEDARLEDAAGRRVRPAASWLFGARVRRAQYLLGTGALSIEQVANATGFGSSAAFRACFSKQVGISPQYDRRSFRPR